MCVHSRAVPGPRTRPTTGFFEPYRPASGAGASPGCSLLGKRLPSSETALYRRGRRSRAGPYDSTITLTSMAGGSSFSLSTAPSSRPTGFTGEAALGSRPSLAGVGPKKTQRAFPTGQ